MPLRYRVWSDHRVRDDPVEGQPLVRPDGDECVELCGQRFAEPGQGVAGSGVAPLAAASR